MSIGSWTPENEIATLSVDEAWLRRCLAVSEEGGLDNLAAQFDEDEQQQYAPVMRMTQEQWQLALDGFGEQELLALMRFFTLAEMQLSGWEAGDRSPVIWINRELRSRGHKLERDMLIWLRENSDNRFIPNGGL